MILQLTLVLPVYFSQGMAYQVRLIPFLQQIILHLSFSDKYIFFFSELFPLVKCQVPQGPEIIRFFKLRKGSADAIFADSFLLQFKIYFYPAPLLHPEPAASKGQGKPFFIQVVLL